MRRATLELPTANPPSASYNAGNWLRRGPSSRSRCKHRSARVTPRRSLGSTKQNPHERELIGRPGGPLIHRLICDLSLDICKPQVAHKQNEDECAGLTLRLRCRERLQFRHALEPGLWNGEYYSHFLDVECCVYESLQNVQIDPTTT